MQTVEVLSDADKVYAGDELELVFYDEEAWLEIEWFKPSAAEFAADLLNELQRANFDIGTESNTLTLLVQSANGFEEVDEEGDTRIGAVVKGRVIDVRPLPEQELQASVGSVLQIVAVVGSVALLLFAIQPVLTEVRRTVRGYTEEEQAVQDFGTRSPSISTVVTLAIVAGAAVALVYLLKRK